MERQDFLLSVMGAVEDCSPVQIQKIVFLIDRKIEKTSYNFIPYAYGPFDKAVYDDLDALTRKGYIERYFYETWRNYRVTDLGKRKYEELYKNVDKTLIERIVKVGTFVKSLSFTELVSAIYRAFPETKQNSVFFAKP